MCTNSPIANTAILVVGGALTGGALAAFAPALAGGVASLGAGASSAFFGGSFAAASAIGGGIIGFGASTLFGMSSAGQQLQVQQQQALPVPESDTTGSGGRDAPRVLAAKIKQVNRERNKVEPTAANLQPQAGTGLQLAR